MDDSAGAGDSFEKTAGPPPSPGQTLTENTGRVRVGALGRDTAG